MISISININDDGLRNLMARWLLKKRKTIEEGLVTAARTLCKAFMEFSLPRDNVKMERTVAGDISRAYATTSSVFLDIRARDSQAADAFWYFQKVGKFSVAQKIMAADSPTFSGLKILPFDKGAAHKAARGARGHVPKGAKPAFVVRGGVGADSKLSRYIAGKQANVGMVKAGWVAAWRDLGRVRDVPAWVRRVRGDSLGSSEKQFGGIAPSIVVHNLVRHADEAIEQRYQSYIEDAAAARLAQYFKIQLGLIQSQ